MAKKKDTSKAAAGLVQLVRDIVRQEVNKLDHTCVIKIVTVNDDGTYDICIEPDDDVIIKGIPALSTLDLEVGDYAYLYKIQNQLSNAFILKRIGR